MQIVISGNLKQAERGGIPSTFNLVGSFVGLTFGHEEHFGLQDRYADNRPLWPMVYYSLRCGDIESALRYIEMAAR